MVRPDRAFMPSTGALARVGLCGLLLHPAAAFMQGTSAQAVVDSFYPARLHPETAIDLRSCYQIAAVASDGTPMRIVAGYTDSAEVALRVLDRNPSGTIDVSYHSRWGTPNSYGPKPSL